MMAERSKEEKQGAATTKGKVEKEGNILQIIYTEDFCIMILSDISNVVISFKLQKQKNATEAPNSGQQKENRAKRRRKNVD